MSTIAGVCEASVKLQRRTCSSSTNPKGYPSGWWVINRYPFLQMGATQARAHELEKGAGTVLPPHLGASGQRTWALPSLLQTKPPSCPLLTWYEQPSHPGQSPLSWRSSDQVKSALVNACSALINAVSVLGIGSHVMDDSLGWQSPEATLPSDILLLPYY